MDPALLEILGSGCWGINLVLTGFSTVLVVDVATKGDPVDEAISWASANILSSRFSRSLTPLGGSGLGCFGTNGVVLLMGTLVVVALVVFTVGGLVIFGVVLTGALVVLTGALVVLYTGAF